MNILFVHQGFPGQYIHIVRALARQGGHQLVALGIEALNMPLPDGLTYIRYPISRGNARDVHPLAAETESKVIRGEACAAAAHQLRKEGFIPDLICAHPGWGESLFLPDIWPSAPILCYQEFYYHPLGLDTDFDPELQNPPGLSACAKVRMKNAYLQLALESSRWNVTPTTFQRSTFPQHWQERISTIHDGIDCQLAAPVPERQPLTLADGTMVLPDEPMITFVNRRIEPTRGCHTLIRAIPELQRLVPRARLLVVGNPQGVSYGADCVQGDWKDQFLAEVEGKYDPSLVHFLGTIHYNHFLALLQRSDCHVYLTYPFVLSWSLLEAMACACPVVGSATLPVQEVIQDGQNGLLVDFFSPRDLAAACAELLGNPKRARKLGEAARNTVMQRYSLASCLPRQLSLMELVASGAIGR